MGVFEDLYSVVELGHFNWPFRNSHPVHPTIVHFPVSFLTAAYILDTAHGATTAFPQTLRLLTPFLADISRFAYVSHAVGLITAIPAMTSGTAEFWELYKTGGINHEDKKLTNPGKSGDELIERSVTIGAAHGLLNAVAFGVSGYALWARARKPSFSPTRANVVLSALTLPGLAISAALGGELVYGKGVGVQRMGYARDEKVAGLKEVKEMGKME